MPTMRCPRCSSQLKSYRYRTIELNVCKTCSGVWFDEGELKVTVDYLLAEHKEIPQAEPLNKGARIDVSALDEPGCVCPRCDVEMEKFNYAFDSNVILDKCPKCSGIWADKGELRKIAIYRKGNANTAELAKLLSKQVEKEEYWRSKSEETRFVPVTPLLLFPVVLPLSDRNRIDTIPFVQIGLIAACVLTFIVQSLAVTDYFSYYSTVGFVPAELFSFKGISSLISSMFVHAGIFHLAGNMLFLWIFGDNIEDYLGHARFIAFYAVCGIGASLVHFAVDPSSLTPAVGASGAISGVMAAYLLIYPKAIVRTLVFVRVVDIPAYAYVGMWVALQIFFAILYSVSGLQPQVAHFAHLGGFATGLVYIWMYREKGTKSLPEV